MVIFDYLDKNESKSRLPIYGWIEKAIRSTNTEYRRQYEVERQMNNPLLLNFI